MNSLNSNRAAEQLAQLARQGSAHYGPHVPEHQQNGFTRQEQPKSKGLLWKIFNVDRWFQQSREEGDDRLKRFLSGLTNEREAEVFLNEIRTQVAKFEVEINRAVKDKRMLKRAEDEVRASDVDMVIRAADAVALTVDYLDKTRTFIEREIAHGPYKVFGCKQVDHLVNLAVARFRINAVGLKYDGDRGNQREFFE